MTGVLDSSFHAVWSLTAAFLALAVVQTRPPPRRQRRHQSHCRRVRCRLREEDRRYPTCYCRPIPALDVVSRTSSTLSSFRPCTPVEVRRIVMTSPIKSCSLDPVPTFLVREFIDLLLPYITSMVNASLADGRLPDSQKQSIVSPL